MLDNLLNNALKGAEKVQRRAEEVAQIARLRFEILQLSREMDSIYARIGRAYHAGAERDALQDLCHQAEQRSEDIKAREKLIEQLGADPKAESADSSHTQPASSEHSLDILKKEPEKDSKQ